MTHLYASDAFFLPACRYVLTVSADCTLTRVHCRALAAQVHTNYTTSFPSAKAAC